MSTRTITRNWKVEGVLTDATSVTLADPTGTYGVKRNDTNAVVVDSGTAVPKIGTGLYEKTFTEPAAGLSYTAYVKVVYAGATYYFEHDLPVQTAPTGTLSVTYPSLQLAIAIDQGLVSPTGTITDVTSLAAGAQAAIDDIIQAGYRQFLWPPPVPLPPGPENVITHQSATQAKEAQTRHRWSFLSPTATLTLVQGQTQYTLPSDFGGGLEFVDADAPGLVTRYHLLALNGTTPAPTAGPPEYYSLSPSSTDGTGVQRWVVDFSPAPGTSPGTLKYTYAVTPASLSTNNPYPYGGPAYGELLLESCLAVAEDRRKDHAGVHRQRFFSLLAACISHDKSIALDGKSEIWPSGDAGASTLDVTYDLLLKRVGHELELPWAYATWSIEDRRKVDMLIHQGLRQFLTPPPLPKEKYGHEWSFLRPITTLTTLAPYTTGTVTVVSGVVTLAGVGAAFPTWATTGYFSCGSTSLAIVASRQSANQITLLDTSINISAGSTYYLYPTSVYDLPTDFAGFDGPMTFDPGVNVLYRPIEMVDEKQVRQNLAVSPITGRPQMGAHRAKNYDGTTWSKYELILWPIPDDDYRLTYKYKVNIAALNSSKTYPPGTQKHGETLLESCLAAVERMDGKPGVHCAQFDRLLAASVSADRQAAAPDFLGYNGDDSDRPSWSPFGHGWTILPTTYNGQVY